MTIKKTFGKYDVELTMYMEFGEQMTNCDVNYSFYGSSLCFLNDYGYIEGTRGGEHQIKQSIIDKIDTWAIDNGY